LRAFLRWSETIKKVEGETSRVPPIMMGYTPTEVSDRLSNEELNAKSNRTFDNSDGNTRTKLILWLLLLKRFFGSNHACCTSLLAPIESKVELLRLSQTPIDTAWDPIFYCLSLIIKRSHLDGIGVNDKAYGTPGFLVIYILSLLADYCFSENSRSETTRFLSKLPGVRGDIADDYVTHNLSESIQAMDTSRFKALNNEKITSEDAAFVSLVFLIPTKNIFQALKEMVDELNKVVTKSGSTAKTITKEEARRRGGQKFWKSLVVREINYSWMKIVNCVGSIVYPTEYVSEGEL